MAKQTKPAPTDEQKQAAIDKAKARKAQLDMAKASQEAARTTFTPEALNHTATGTIIDDPVIEDAQGAARTPFNELELEDKLARVDEWVNEGERQTLNILADLVRTQAQINFGRSATGTTIVQIKSVDATNYPGLLVRSPVGDHVSPDPAAALLATIDLYRQGIARTEATLAARAARRPPNNGYDPQYPNGVPIAYRHKPDSIGHAAIGTGPKVAVEPYRGGQSRPLGSSRRLEIPDHNRATAAEEKRNG